MILRYEEIVYSLSETSDEELEETKLEELGISLWVVSISEGFKWEKSRAECIGLRYRTMDLKAEDAWSSLPVV